MPLAAIALILVTGSVFFLCLVVFSVLSRAYGRYQERYVVRSRGDLGDILLMIEPQQILVLDVASLCVFALISYFSMNLLMAVMLGCAGFFVPSLLIGRYRKNRIRKFNVQLVDALQAMANAFKAGLTFPQAIEQIARDSQAPLSQEFGLFIKEIKLGVAIEDGLNNLAARVGSEDLALMVVSTNVSRQLGGNMAEMFETLSSTIRERFRLEGKIDALTSQGRMQGWIVAAMPALLGVILNYMRPDLIQPMMHHIFGYVLVALICVMEALGIFLIRRIVDIDV